MEQYSNYSSSGDHHRDMWCRVIHILIDQGACCQGIHQKVPMGRLDEGCGRSVFQEPSFLKFHGQKPTTIAGQVHEFSILNVIEALCLTTPSMHMEDNAARWLQMQKSKHGPENWNKVIKVVKAKFGSNA